MGALTESVRMLIPASYRAMIGPSEETDYYSLSDLQTLVERVEFKLFATVVGVTEEATAFNPTQLDFIGKVSTLKFIPAAIDYWMDQSETVNTHGPEESETFPNRLASLTALFKQLSAEVADEIQDVVPGTTPGWAPAVSYGDNGRGVLITPDPQLVSPLVKGWQNPPVLSFDLDHFLAEDWEW